MHGIQSRTPGTVDFVCKFSLKWLFSRTPYIYIYIYPSYYIILFGNILYIYTYICIYIWYIHILSIPFSVFLISFSCLISITIIYLQMTFEMNCAMHSIPLICWCYASSPLLVSLINNSPFFVIQPISPIATCMAATYQNVRYWIFLCIQMQMTYFGIFSENRPAVWCLW